MLVELGAAEDEIRGLGRGQEGLIRVSTECYTTYHWLPAALKDFELRFPSVAVEIVVEATRRPLAALLEGRLDVAIVSRPSRNRDVTCRKLFDDEMVVVGARAPPGEGPFVREEIARDAAALRDPHRAERPVPARRSSRQVSPARLVRVELTGRSSSWCEKARASRCSRAGPWSPISFPDLVGAPLGPRGLRRSPVRGHPEAARGAPHLADAWD
jgi:LysR family transcriptional regulator for metE and metH